MANVKISELPLGTPNSTSIFPFVDAGTTYQGAISAITSNSTVQVTYSELVNKITGETLNTGSYYIITDFRTCYDQPDFNSYGNEIIGDNYKQSDIDPIVVLATSSNTISTTAYQPSYPKDRIQYDWTFSSTERTQGIAYGRISERIDEFNNRTDYDHRTIQFKRYQYIEIDFDSPYQGTVSISPISSTEMTVTGTDTNFTSLSTGQYVGFRNGSDFRVYEITSISGNTLMVITGLTNINTGSGVEVFPAYSQTNTSYLQNNITTAYTEYYTFDYNNFNVNNYIGNYANSYVYDENSFLLANNVFQGLAYRNNTFGDMCYNNSFDDDCENNTIGNYFYNNITDDDFDGNIIGNRFNNNRITSNFQYNRIGENFQLNNLVQNSFYRNNIMNGFEYNIISGNDFQNNEIGSGFNNNVIRYGQFYKNDIGNGYNYNKVYSDFYGNLIGNGFANNTIYCEFNDNTIGEYYGGNILGDIDNLGNSVFSQNKVATSFSNNTITQDFYKNQIGAGFYSNDISGSTTHNVIGNTFENNTIYSSFYNNKISNEFKGNMMLGTFENNNIDSFVGGNQFSGGTYSNNIGTYTFSNDFLGQTAGNTWRGSFYSNTIGDYFNGNSFYGEIYENTIGNNFYGNNIQSYFYQNTIGNGFQTNEIKNYFNNNTVGDNFGYGYANPQGNKIGSNFYDNSIGEYFYNNSIPDNFYSNEIGNYFQWNVIDTNIDRTSFSLNYGNLTGFSYTAAGTGATNNFYSGIQICGTTQSMGIGATFDVNVSGGTVTGVSGNTEGRLYVNGDVLTILGTQIGGVTGVISGFTSDAVGKSGTTGSYTGLPSTGGNGGSATFDITVSGGVVTDIQLNNGGNGYLESNVLTISGSLFGGVDDIDDITITVTILYSDDIVITVTGVTSGSLFYEHYTKQIFERKLGNKRVSYYDEDDILNVDSIYEVSGYIPVNSQSLTFPINYTSFEFQCNGSYTNNGDYTSNQTNSTQDVVNLFNNIFRSFGYFFDNNDGTVGLYINPSLKQQWCPSGTYTINVFND